MEKRRIIRNIIVVAVCVTVLAATFGLLYASGAATALNSAGGALANGDYVADNMTLSGQITVAGGVTATIDGKGSTITWNGVGDNKSPFNVDGNLTVKNVTIVTNSVNNPPIFNVKGTLTLVDVTIRDPSGSGSSTHGGAIKVEGATALTLTRTTFEGCVAAEGGAVYIGNNTATTVSITDCSFINCRSTQTAATGAGYYNTHGISYFGGGAICIRNENTSGSIDLSISGSAFTNCSAGLDGGAINVKCESPTINTTNGTLKLSITDSTFDGCTAKDGGAIQLAGKGKIDFDFTNSTIQNSYAAADIGEDSGFGGYVGGGAINIMNTNATSTYDFVNSAFENNESKYNGGAIRVVGELIFTDSSNNNAEYTITTGVPAGASISISGCEFNENRSRWGNAIFLTGQCSPTLNISNSLFKDNETVATFEPSSAYGGTISAHWRAGSPATVTQCLFIGNESLGSSMTSGGAFYWSGYYGSLGITDCHFYDNRTTGQGGALFFEGKNISVTGTAVPSEQRLDSLDITALRGGALKGKGTLIRDNSSDYYGGGVAFKSCGSVSGMSGGSVSLGNGVLITENSAKQGGGFAYRVVESTNNNIANNTVYSVTVNGAVIKGNSAGDSGGGVYMEKSMLDSSDIKCTMNFIFSDGIIANNTSKRVSGGIAVMDANDGDRGLTHMDMNGGTVTGNSAVTKGGGILVYGGTFTMSGGEVTGNSIALPVSKLSEDDAANYGGGGIFVHNTDAETPVNINGGTVSGNIASVIGTIPQGETDNANGGGIFVNGGVKMAGGTVTKNATSGNGGGFYVNRGSLTIDSGTVSENSANISGGALAVMGSGNVTIGKSGCDGISNSHSHPIITKNTSVTSGGGAVVAGGIVTMYCGEIISNTASKQAATNNLSVGTGGKFIIYGGYLGLGYTKDVDKFTDHRDTVSVKYYDAAGNLSSTTQTVPKGEEFTTKALKSLGGTLETEKTGWSVLGWRAQDGTTTAEGGVMRAGYADMELTVVWTPNCAPLRVTADDCPEDDHVTIFRIQSTTTDTGVSVDIRVAVQGNRNETVYLPLGTYKVTVEKGWRYDYNNVIWNGVVITRGEMTDLGVSIGGAANDRWLNYYTIYE